jgi:hypothetical protein
MFKEKYNIKIFYLILFIVIADFFSEPVLQIYPFDLSKYDAYNKILISFLFLLFFLSTFNKFSKNLIITFPFYTLLLVILYGLLRGLITNVPINAINDTSSYLAIILFPAIVCLNFKDINKTINTFADILLFILLFKFIIYEILCFTIIGFPSWKILLKQSPLLLFPFSIYFSNYMNNINNKRNIFLLLITCLLIITAMARMLFISVLFITLIYTFFKIKNIKKVILIIFLLLIAFTFYLSLSQIDNFTEITDHLYGGDVYAGGVDYRKVQFQVLLNRIIDHPLSGVGFGFYNKEYLIYGIYAKPYILELDLINFITKLGLIISIIYFFIYLNLYYLVLKVKNQKNKEIYFAMFLCLIGLLIYSVGQSFHQGYLYWIYFSVFYSFLFLELKLQK